MTFKTPIAIGLSPNTEKDDILEAIKTIAKPWLWRDGTALNNSRKWFERYLGSSEVYFFNSCRSALFLVLQSFGIGSGDEVLMQVFTCVAVPDPVIWTGAKPIYVDIEETCNMDPSLLERHINIHTKAIIVQHTFGVPAKIDLVKKIAQKHKLILIEDCAHSLGAESNGKKVGTFGDAAIFSFGRDKVISSVFGGMANINKKWKIENVKLRKLYQELKYPSYFWILQQLLHPIFFAIILPLYKLLIGKVFLAMLLKIKLLSKPVNKEEMIGGKPDIFPAKYPNGLAILLLHQLNKLDRYNKSRRKITSYYFEKLKNLKNVTLPSNIDGAIYLRFNILTPNAEVILDKAKTKGILLGNWYRNIIDPKEVDFGKIGYTLGSCPNAEEKAKLSVNLPTYKRLTESDLDSIINLF